MPRRKIICRPSGGGKNGVLREKEKLGSFRRKRGQGHKEKEEPGPPRRKTSKGSSVGRRTRVPEEVEVPGFLKSRVTQRGRRVRVPKEEEPSSP